jgi:hypothetical protein
MTRCYCPETPQGYKGKKYSRSEAHDKLYKLACKLLDRMSACSKCPVFINDTKPSSCGFSKSWCCQGCPHLDTKTGCTVEALLCRLHLCAPEGQRQGRESPILRRRMGRLKNIATSYNLLMARASKDQALELGEKHDVWWLYRHGATEADTGEI